MSLMLSQAELRFGIYTGLLLYSVASQAADIRFAVIGDFGRDSLGEQAVANLVKSWDKASRLDFIMTTGDNNYPFGRWQDIHNNIGKYYGDYIHLDNDYAHNQVENRFYPVLGNHDWGNTDCSSHNPDAITPYLNYFMLPGNERYYEVRKGNVHIFALDSDCHEPDNRPDSSAAGSAQKTWLKERLQKSDATWKIVYFHHPPYTSGLHGLDSGDPGRQMAWPFREWGASAVISGHDHNYERLLVNGLPYFVNGLGGAERRWLGKCLTDSRKFYADDHGAMLLTATKNRLNFKFVTVTGEAIDDFSMTKTGFVEGSPTDKYRCVTSP